MTEIKYQFTSNDALAIGEYILKGLATLKAYAEAMDVPLHATGSQVVVLIDDYPIGLSIEPLDADELIVTTPEQFALLQEEPKGSA